MPSDHSADDFFCVATVLPIRRWQDVLPFLLLARQVGTQLGASPGLVRYRVKAGWLRKRFWTVSVWRTKVAMQAFVRTGAHARAVGRFSEWAAPGAAFVEWYSPEERVRWREAFERLKANIQPFTAERFIEAGESYLRTLGVTRQKAHYCIQVAQAFNDGRLDQLGRLNDEDAHAVESGGVEHLPCLD